MPSYSGAQSWKLEPTVRQFSLNLVALKNESPNSALQLDQVIQ